MGQRVSRPVIGRGFQKTGQENVAIEPHIMRLAQNGPIEVKDNSIAIGAIDGLFTQLNASKAGRKVLPIYWEIKGPQ